MKHYLVDKERNPVLFSASDPSFGLSGSSVRTGDGNRGTKSNFTCIFKRDNIRNLAGYYPIDEKSQYYIQVAYGPG